MRIVKNNNLIIEKPDVVKLNKEEVYLWFKQLNLNINLETVKNNYLDGKIILNIDPLKLISIFDYMMKKI